VRNTYAQRAPTADYELSLLLLLASLAETGKPANLYEHITGANELIHAKTQNALKETLSRVPWLPGHYQAAGVDPGAIGSHCWSRTITAVISKF
jgi:hypothetical protein